MKLVHLSRWGEKVNGSIPPPGRGVKNVYLSPGTSSETRSSLPLGRGVKIAVSPPGGGLKKTYISPLVEA